MALLSKIVASFTIMKMSDKIVRWKLNKLENFNSLSAFYERLKL